VSVARIFISLLHLICSLAKAAAVVIALTLFYTLYQTIAFPAYWILFRIYLAKHRVPREVAREVVSMYSRKLRSSYTPLAVIRSARALFKAFTRARAHTPA